MKGVIQKVEQTTNRNFGYMLDGVKLEFTLRVDVKKEINAFLVLMEAATKELKDILADAEQSGKPLK